MPEEWAKAFLPTIALLGCTGIRINVETRREVFEISLVSMLVKTRMSLRHFAAITTSSRAVFPALSPMPLIVTSACLAPFIIPAIVLAVAMPRSLWQWVDMIALSILGTLFRKKAIFW